MRRVVFVRNVNLGQRGQPSTADLLRAFAAAGASDAVSVQSNGTVVVESTDPSTLAEAVEDALEAATGIRREVFALPLTVIASIVTEHAVGPAASRCEVSVYEGSGFDAGSPVARDAQRRGRCRVLSVGDHEGAAWAVVLNDAERQSNGTPVVERIMGGPATSRSLATLRRVVERFEDGRSR